MKPAAFERNSQKQCPLVWGSGLLVVQYTDSQYNCYVVPTKTDCKKCVFFGCVGFCLVVRCSFWGWGGCSVGVRGILYGQGEGKCTVMKTGCISQICSTTGSATRNRKKLDKGTNEHEQQQARTRQHRSVAER